jgi:hypothetical protein
MQITGKAFAVAAMLMAAVSACSGPTGQPTTGSSGGGTSPAQSESSSAPNSTSSAGAFAQAPPSSGSPPPAHPAGAAPDTNNQVVLGAQFAGAPPFSFGNVLPGESKTMRFEIVNLAQQQVTVVSVTTDLAAFTATGDCDNRVLNIGDICTLSVTFRPTADGTYNAALIITLDPSSVLSNSPALEGSAGSSPNPTDSPAQPSDTSTPSDQFT